MYLNTQNTGTINRFPQFHNVEVAHPEQNVQSNGRSSKLTLILMPLSAGHKFGPYELVSPLGAGGMGEVWKARDTRLGRDVALKVSKSEFTARFEREARTVAAFNHPNICQLYDVGPNYL